ncbi:hypothetical protein HYDPIDRAFT_107472 [Hydnomerulius pinastri MD-312]|nr:hypothetical protein HYDPIDRAFT_107472 [Hydnomerulius pinastri MD-312]
MAPQPPAPDWTHNRQPHEQRSLRGTQPGLLDPSQSSRLLRDPDSKLIFASFDPRTALADDSYINTLNINDDLPPPKRVVIETSPKSISFWRFVPRARLEEGVLNEGIWPRDVYICGELIHCYQEQWEIYKLDPAYQCTVHSWPNYPSITKIDPPNQTPRTTDQYAPKRTRSASPETSEPALQKRARSQYLQPCISDDSDDFDSDFDEEEVEEMVVDERHAPRMPKPNSGRQSERTSREQIKKERLARWAKNRKAQEKHYPEPPIAGEGSFSMRVDSEDNTATQSSTLPTEECMKRKGGFSSDVDSDDEAPPIRGVQMNNHGHKRARTISPNAARTAARQAHAQRERKKMDRIRVKDYLNEMNRNELFMAYMEEIRPSDIPPGDDVENGIPKARSTGQEDPRETGLDPGPIREAEIAESIRKLRELDQDRPLWEEQRRRREAKERAEEQERLAKAEERNRAEARRKKQDREEAERERRRAQEEAERLAREEELRQEERRQRENHQRRQRQRWESGPWTTLRALERYRTLCDEFDGAKFTADKPITFHDIPWPVLHQPSRLTVEDVDWSAVEAFFAAAKADMRPQDYKAFVEKSHRRFHPDRWRARKVWSAVADEVERGYLEVAANTTAQALTPIWTAVKLQ